MAELSYDREITALLVIDPYNDFISEGGSLWRYRGERGRPGSQRASPESGLAAQELRIRHLARRGPRGIQAVAGDIVASEHWCSSGFASTDLDQQLKTHGIHRVILIGLAANTCVEATARFAAELGYDVTVVSDAVASSSEEEMHAALGINLPKYATAIVPASEIAGAISAAPARPPGT